MMLDLQLLVIEHIATILLKMAAKHVIFPIQSQLNISAGEALLLPNILSSALLPRRAIDKEMRLKELFGHSVCPPVKEIYRPILIADFDNSKWKRGYIRRTKRIHYSFNNSFKLY